MCFDGRHDTLGWSVQVWVLDALPGEVRTGSRETQDHPAALIAHLQQIPLPLPNRTALQNNLLDSGFSLTVARWASTNLRPLNGDHRYSFALLSVVCMFAAFVWQLQVQLTYLHPCCYVHNDKSRLLMSTFVQRDFMIPNCTLFLPP